jgi:hypothetical protein
MLANAHRTLIDTGQGCINIWKYVTIIFIKFYLEIYGGNGERSGNHKREIVFYIRDN